MIPYHIVQHNKESHHVEVRLEEQSCQVGGVPALLQRRLQQGPVLRLHVSTPSNASV